MKKRIQRIENILNEIIKEEYSLLYLLKEKKIISIEDFVEEQLIKTNAIDVLEQVKEELIKKINLRRKNANTR